LDSRDYRAVDHVNLLFPSLEALGSIDGVLDSLRSRQRDTQQQIASLLHGQPSSTSSSSGVRMLEDTSTQIHSLQSRIAQIKLTAEQAEQVVVDITRDVKSLDNAKRNLIHTITVLKRIQMLGSAIAQLRSLVDSRQYRESGLMLQAVQDMMAGFKEYRNVRDIADASTTIFVIQRELAKQVFSEFDAAFTIHGVLSGDPKLLSDATFAVDAMGEAERVKIVDFYVDLQLKQYTSAMLADPEVAGLDNVARRYAWLRRMLQTYTDKHADIFPKDWEVAKQLSIRFADITRKQLASILSKSNPVDVDALVKAILTTLVFEEQLAKRFPGPAPSASDSSTPSNPFDRCISGGLEPYLRYFIDAEDKKLSALMTSYRLRPALASDITVLPSCTELLHTFQTALTSLTKLTSRQSLLELATIFGKWLSVYATDLLPSKLPREDPKQPFKPLTTDEFRTLCLIVNTADYCAVQTPQLRQKIVDRLEPELKDLVVFDNQLSAFMAAATQALKNGVKAVLNACEPHFVAMTKLNWSSMSVVGDQSEYMGQIVAQVNIHMSEVRHVFTASKYTRSFCDRLSEALATRLMTALQKIRKASDCGFEQMLVDIQSLKAAVVQLMVPQKQSLSTRDRTDDMPASMPASSAPAGYIKYVNKVLGRCESLIKAAIAPIEPPSEFVQNLLALCPDATAAQLQMVLELKGAKRSEQSTIQDMF
ncbi:hypothetical protein GQ42DRAFT_102591, partial [Ramicandelaber brevisporus]